MIVRDRADRVILYTKGADSMIFPVISERLGFLFFVVFICYPHFFLILVS